MSLRSFCTHTCGKVMDETTTLSTAINSSPRETRPDNGLSCSSMSAFDISTMYGALSCKGAGQGYRGRETCIGCGRERETNFNFISKTIYITTVCKGEGEGGWRNHEARSRGKKVWCLRVKAGGRVRARARDREREKKKEKERERDLPRSSYRTHTLDCTPLDCMQTTS